MSVGASGPFLHLVSIFAARVRGSGPGLVELTVLNSSTCWILSAMRLVIVQLAILVPCST